MNVFAKLFSVLLHPILMPLTGVACYYFITPSYTNSNVIKAILAAISILTIATPILIALALKKLNLIDSLRIPNARQRILPLGINLFITASILFKLMPRIDAVPLYYFFIGILGSTICCFILALVSQKPSIHTTGISGVTMFIVGLSFHYQINLTEIISCFILATGIVITSRLYLKAHNLTEIILGLIFGIIPQMLSFNYWL